MRPPLLLLLLFYDASLSNDESEQEGAIKKKRGKIGVVLIKVQPAVELCQGEINHIQSILRNKLWTPLGSLFFAYLHRTLGRYLHVNLNDALLLPWAVFLGPSPSHLGLPGQIRRSTISYTLYLEEYTYSSMVGSHVLALLFIISQIKP